MAAKRLQSPKGAELFPERSVKKPVAIAVPLLPRAAFVVPPRRFLWITNTLIWEYPTNWNLVTNIVLYRWTSLTSTNSTNSLGHVLTTKITRTNAQYFGVTAVDTNGIQSDLSNILKIPTPQNLIVHVTVSGGGTNIYTATSLSGPWSKLNTTNYWVTNQFGTHYYRGKGKAGNRVAIAAQLN
jgi:hypothetical protein